MSHKKNQNHNTYKVYFYSTLLRCLENYIQCIIQPRKNGHGERKELNQADSEILKAEKNYIYICICIYTYIYIGELDSLVNQLYEMHAGSKNIFKTS